MSKKKVVLAYSGGLDTSYCVKYFTEDKDYEVHTVLVDTGGFSADELKEVSDRAIFMGAKNHENIMATDDFYQNCIKYMIFGNTLRNNTYPLSVSAERVFQAKSIAEHVKKIGADAVAHGSTGAAPRGRRGPRWGRRRPRAGPPSRRPPRGPSGRPAPD